MFDALNLQVNNDWLTFKLKGGFKNKGESVFQCFELNHQASRKLVRNVRIPKNRKLIQKDEGNKHERSFISFTRYLHSIFRGEKVALKKIIEV